MLLSIFLAEDLLRKDKHPEVVQPLIDAVSVIQLMFSLDINDELWIFKFRSC